MTPDPGLLVLMLAAAICLLVMAGGKAKTP